MLLLDAFSSSILCGGIMLSNPFIIDYLMPLSVKLKYYAQHCIKWAGCTLRTSLEIEKGRHSAQNTVLYTAIMEETK